MFPLPTYLVSDEVGGQVGVVQRRNYFWTTGTLSATVLTLISNKAMVLSVCTASMPKYLVSLLRPKYICTARAALEGITNQYSRGPQLPAPFMLPIFALCSGVMSEY